MQSAAQTIPVACLNIDLLGVSVVYFGKIIGDLVLPTGQLMRYM